MDAETVETGGSAMESDPVLTQAQLEVDLLEREPPLVPELTDTNIVLAQRQLENKMDKIAKTLSTVTTMLCTLAETVKLLQDGENSSISTGQATASSELNLPLALESPNQGEEINSIPSPAPSTSTGQSTAPSKPNLPLALELPNQGEEIISLLSPEPSQVGTSKTAMQNEEIETLPSLKEQKGPNPTRRPLRGPDEPAVWASRLCSTMALAKSSIPKFNGESIPAYWEFKRSLRRLFQETDLSQARQLEILVEAYSGPMKENLRSCLAMENQKEGYERAWALLEKRHGNKNTYIRQLTERLLVGPSVSLQDPKGMTRLVDDMLICIDGLKAMGQLHQIDNLQTTLAVAKRFKGRLLHDHTTKRHEYRKQHGDAPGIEWLAAFVKDMVDMSDDIMQDPEQGQRAPTSEDRHAGRVSSKSSGVKDYAVLATISDAQEDENGCPLCERDHLLQHCEKFLDMTLENKETVAQSQRRCFSCLGRDHQMVVCTRKERCGINGCPWFHSRLLHRTGTRDLSSGTRHDGGHEGRPSRGIAWNPAGSKRNRPEDVPKTGVRDDAKRFRSIGTRSPNHCDS